MSKILTVQQVIAKYGRAGDLSNLVKVETPFPLRVAWDLNVTIKKFDCHKLVADRLKAIFQEILDTYGEQQVNSLGINLYGGCFNHRPMRGTEIKYKAAMDAKNYELAATYLSRHSWGIAIDLSPTANALRVKWKDSQFAKPVYKPMIDIFYKHGFLSYGIEKGFDSMHFEAAN